jgi:hypothetical protein
VYLQLYTTNFDHQTIELTLPGEPVNHGQHMWPVLRSPEVPSSPEAPPTPVLGSREVPQLSPASKYEKAAIAKEKPSTGSTTESDTDPEAELQIPGPFFLF